MLLLIVLSDKEKNWIPGEMHTDAYEKEWMAKQTVRNENESWRWSKEWLKKCKMKQECRGNEGRGRRGIFQGHTANKGDAETEWEEEGGQYSARDHILYITHFALPPLLGSQCLDPIISWVVFETFSFSSCHLSSFYLDLYQNRVVWMMSLIAILFIGHMSSKNVKQNKNLHSWSIFFFYSILSKTDKMTVEEVSAFSPPRKIPGY